MFCDVDGKIIHYYYELISNHYHDKAKLKDIYIIKFVILPKVYKMLVA